MLKRRVATFLYTQPRVEKKGTAYIPPKLAQALINRTTIIKVKHQLAWVRALVFHMSTSSRPGERPEAEIDEERIQEPETRTAATIAAGLSEVAHFLPFTSKWDMYSSF